ncbi:MAG: IS91 family transposase [Vicinamibacteria bacterium]
MEQTVSLGAIASAKGGEFLTSFPSTPQQRKVLRLIADCRTEALGGHSDQCDRCGFKHIFWNSCRDRHCPGCGAEARDRWLDERREELLDVPYFHVVFTIPGELRPLAHCAPALVYAILLRAAGQALLDVGATKLRARLGSMVILHTWTQQLQFHPHVHCVVPGGGVSRDGKRWIRVPMLDFLFAVKVLSRRFRTLVCKGITEAYARGSLSIPDPIAHDRTALDLLLVRASKTDWHAYVKPPFGGPEQVLAYLAAYTHRIAISNFRIKAFDGQSVTFSYRDYNAGNAQNLTSLPATEFLRRFLLHVVPPRFTRIRYYGLLANRDRRANLQKARTLIGSTRQLRPRAPGPDPRLCPQCQKGTMRTVGRVDPQRARTWFDSS